jgi:Tol biopolymer transport system component
MLKGPKPKLLLSILVLAAALILPAAAHATLAYVKYGHYPLNPSVFTAADDGLEEIRVGWGYEPKVSPNGDLVAYVSGQHSSRRHRLKVVSAFDGARDQIFDAAKISYVTWSPDSSQIAAVRGPRRGKEKLVLVNVANGSVRVLARGHFSGVSFSPGGGEIAFSRAVPYGKRSGSDVFRLSTRGARGTHRITYDHRSKRPVWGPNGQIAFVKEMGRKGGRQLFEMKSDGGSIVRLAGRKVAHKWAGITPVTWSQNGRLLLVNSYPHPSLSAGFALVFEPGTHTRWGLRKRRDGFVGAAFSCNGKEVLGSSGGFHALSDHLVSTVSSSGSGSGLTVLQEFAFEPSWNACGE